MHILLLMTLRHVNGQQILSQSKLTGHSAGSFKIILSRLLWTLLLSTVKNAMSSGDTWALGPREHT